MQHITSDLPTGRGRSVRVYARDSTELGSDARPLAAGLTRGVSADGKLDE